MDIPTTNPDIPLPAVIKSPAVLFFRTNELPKSTVPRVKTRKMTISIMVNCIVLLLQGVLLEERPVHLQWSGSKMVVAMYRYGVASLSFALFQ